jgi:2-polyprenyl-6-methoxyphenol hydroxylase-like FAD-dependent oxidoreductase
MGFHWAGKSLQALLPPALWDRLQSAHVAPQEPVVEEDVLKFVNGRTGEFMSGFPVKKFFRLQRSKLRKLFSEGINLRFDKKLSDISYPDDEKVVAHFTDGSSVRGKMIVGADGARSTVRELLLGHEAGRPRRLPYAATFVQSRFTAEQARYLRSFHPLYLGSAHPDGYFAFFGMHDCPDASNPESWTFFYYISWNCSLEKQEATRNWTDAQRLAQQKELAKRFADPWKSAYEWTPEGTPVWYLGLTEWDPGAEGHRWDNREGRVTLIGDAAHPMTYQRGQGLNHSITDCAELATALKKCFHEPAETMQGEAVSEYEESMIARAGEEVRLCTKNTEMLHHWNLVMQSPIMASGMKKGLKTSEYAK